MDLRTGVNFEYRGRLNLPFCPKFDKIIFGKRIFCYWSDDSTLHIVNAASCKETRRHIDESKYQFDRSNVRISGDDKHMIAFNRTPLCVFSFDLTDPRKEPLTYTFSFMLEEDWCMQIYDIVFMDVDLFYVINFAKIPEMYRSDYNTTIFITQMDCNLKKHGYSDWRLISTGITNSDTEIVSTCSTNGRYIFIESHSRVHEYLFIYVCERHNVVAYHIVPSGVDMLHAFAC